MPTTVATKLPSRAAHARFRSECKDWSSTCGFGADRSVARTRPVVEALLDQSVPSLRITDTRGALNTGPSQLTLLGPQEAMNACSKPRQVGNCVVYWDGTLFSFRKQSGGDMLAQATEWHRIERTTNSCNFPATKRPLGHWCYEQETRFEHAALRRRTTTASHAPRSFDSCLHRATRLDRTRSRHCHSTRRIKGLQNR